MDAKAKQERYCKCKIGESQLELDVAVQDEAIN